MEVKINREAGIAEIWLTKAERDNKEFRESLKPLYKKFRAEKLLPAVFLSGDKDLFDLTAALLKYNRRRSAELEVKRAKA